MAASTAIAASTAVAGKGISVNVTLPLFGHSITVFVALYGLAINLVVAIAASLLLRLFRANPGTDGTTPSAYA